MASRRCLSSITGASSASEACDPQAAPDLSELQAAAAAAFTSGWSSAAWAAAGVLVEQRLPGGVLQLIALSARAVRVRGRLTHASPIGVLAQDRLDDEIGHTPAPVDRVGAQ